MSNCLFVYCSFHADDLLSLFLTLSLDCFTIFSHISCLPPPSFCTSLLLLCFLSLLSLFFRLVSFLLPLPQNDSFFLLPFFILLTTSLPSLPLLIFFHFSLFIYSLLEHSPNSIVFSLQSALSYPFLFFIGSRMVLFSQSTTLFSSVCVADNGASALATR